MVPACKLVTNLFEVVKQVTVNNRHVLNVQTRGEVFYKQRVKLANLQWKAYQEVTPNKSYSRAVCCMLQAVADNILDAILHLGVSRDHLCCKKLLVYLTRSCAVSSHVMFPQVALRQSL